MLLFSPLPAGKAGLSAVRGLSSAMGVGVSLLLQFSLTSGGCQSVGRRRRCGRRSIPRRSWTKPHLQLHSLQGRVPPSSLGSQFLPEPQHSGLPILGKEGACGGRIPFSQPGAFAVLSLAVGSESRLLGGGVHTREFRVCRSLWAGSEGSSGVQPPPRPSVAKAVLQDSGLPGAVELPNVGQPLVGLGQDQTGDGGHGLFPLLLMPG